MHIHANKIEVEFTENSRPVVEKFNLRSFSYCLKNKLMFIFVYKKKFISCHSVTRVSTFYEIAISK